MTETSSALFSPRPQPACISCVLPAFNESAHLSAFLGDLQRTLSTLATTYEIIVVNDGSSDATDEVMRAHLSQPGIRYLSLSRNFGKEAALTAGIDCARGDAVILMDADYQHPLELLPQMVGLWRTGYDMVYGVIADRRDESLLKRWGTNLFYRIMESGTSINIPRNAGDFRLMDRRVVAALRQLSERNRFMKGLYAWVGFNSVALPFVPHARATGVSSFGLRGLGRLALSGLTAFTTLPLRIWSAVGAVISLISMLYALEIVVETVFFGNPTAGWSTLAVGLMFFSGVQLISIGILGEYMGRIYDEVKRRPLYLVAQDVDNGMAAGAEISDAEHRQGDDARS
ncbi:glycosyltransferase family 2 protein [Herbaspirillum sp. RTI4]|uniref:glycosyltransferase family 2 protein n=1 Tax=Herbaspirillum sp. RTI4 TaxID=3048640 RepID=UPI002AB5478C|nr:glycosyltransferase family 2 protein [Herbaspirillum sp. RTI4]MDY7577791.1 glycosyltransferase family 2 protein [Herbaspirillum sp. RTI4]MEA9980781.1 glycosyltransferase family 2 protein [Herbaspirillum sp. RTI4]